MKPMPVRPLTFAWLTLAALQVGCAAWGGLGLVVAPAAGPGLRSLAEPRGVDWATTRIGAPGLGERRQAWLDGRRRASLALAGARPFGLLGTWPAAHAGWTAAGFDPTSVSAGCGEVVNGMAAGMPWQVGSTERYIYMLTKNGVFLRVRGDAPGTSPVAVTLSGTFENTSIALSPAATRAYVLNGASQLFVIDLNAMTVINTGGTTVGSSTAHFLAPTVDPALSMHDDFADVVYVPNNDGNVYVVRMGRNDTTPSVSAARAVATDAVARTGCDGCGDFSSHKLAAPGVAFRGRYFVGDTQGRLHDHDMTNDVALATYPVSSVAGIAAPPAIELDDAAGTFTDAAGATVTLNAYDPRHAFVNVTRASGPACAWVDLARRTVTFSQPLFLDDQAGDDFGELKAYGYDVSASGTTEIEVDGTSGRALSVADTSGSTFPPPAGGQAYLAAKLLPCTDFLDGNGGGSNVFFRVDTSGLASGAVLTEAELELYSTQTRAVAPPAIYRVAGLDATGSTGRFKRGTTTLWDTSTNALDPGTAPVIFDATHENRQGFTAGGGLFAASTTFTATNLYQWRVLDALPAPTPVGQVAFALRYSDAETSPNYYGAPEFEPGSSDYPLLRLQHRTVANRPSFPVETAPILDATRKRVYVYVSNVLFCLKFDDPTAWMDADAADSHTGYQVAYLARDAATARFGARDAGGAFYRNKVTPVPAFDVSSVHVLSQAYDGGTSSWDVALSKIKPDRATSGRAADDLGGSDLDQAGIAGKELPVSGGQVASPYGARFLLIDPYSNLQTKGGDLYVSLGNPNRVYRYGTDD
ncbi:MAG: hypothetical protein VKQ33_03750 [Candidatus Sericytochromatia bacterium]|nr:hypothetical protein [Candidatus Sericytochromatia bacterium]